VFDDKWIVQFRFGDETVEVGQVVFVAHDMTGAVDTVRAGNHDHVRLGYFEPFLGAASVSHVEFMQRADHLFTGCVLVLGSIAEVKENVILFGVD